jgi:hypothetical protein
VIIIPSNKLLVGFSKKDITPEKSVRMGGYGYRKGKSIGIHDRLYAHAIYFSYNDTDDNITEFAMVSLDILGLFNKYVNYYRKIIEEKTGIPRYNILIHCVHNHSAPDTVGLTDVKGFFTRTLNLDNFKLIGRRIIDAISEAKKNAEPSKIGADKKDASKRLIVNRREPKKDSRYKVGVIRIDDLKGELKGLIINYACHGTVLPSDNRKFSADYIGYINKTIEKLSNKRVFSIYFNGTCGDINPNLMDFNINLDDIDKGVLYDAPTGLKGDFDRAKDIGGSIAKTAWNLAKEIKTSEVKKVIIKHKEILIPTKNIVGKYTLKNTLMDLIFKIKYKLLMLVRKFSNISNYNFVKDENGDIKIKSEIQVIRINDIVFPTLPGEFLINLGEKVLKESPSENTFVIELANDCAGYFFSIEDYLEGGYEALMSFSPLGGTFITNELIDLIKKSFNNK